MSISPAAGRPCQRAAAVPPMAALGLAVVGLCVCGAAKPASAANWFVDGVNGRSYNSGTAAGPFQSLTQAMLVAQPGDTVYVLPTMVYGELIISANGTASQPVTVMGAGAAPARTRVSGGSANPAILVTANYVTVANFDATTTGPMTGILVASNQHHITITNNVVHGAGGDGINTSSDDYVTISHNTVYGNAWNTTLAFGSGISTLGNLDIDSNTGIKMVIDSNVVYGNSNTPNNCDAQCLMTWTDSDGSGIIVDNSRRTRFDNIVYQGRTQISNNVVFGNGGRGVHVYLSDHVTITGNTMYSNNQDPYEGSFHAGEVTVAYGGDVQVYNNILYSDGLSGPANDATPSTHVSVAFEYCTDGTGPLIAKYNLMFDPQNAIANEYYVDPTTTNPVTISSNFWTGAKFENPTIVYPHAADYRPKPISPALHRADPATSVAYDILGKPRLLPPTVGAYENPGP